MSNTIQQEKTRIDGLLEAGQISTEDHKILVDALEKKETSSERLTRWMFSPYETLSARNALGFGLVAALVMSFFAYLAKVYFPGAIDLQVLQDGKRAYNVIDLLIQNVIAIFTLSSVFYLVALVFKQKNLRFVDFLGYIALSRYPYALLVLLLFAVGSFFPAFLPRSPDVTKGWEVMTLAIVSLAAVVWQMILLFKAYRVSSGFSSKSLWFSFIGGLILAETLSVGLNILIFK